MTDTVSFSDVQLQKILTTLETMKSGGIHWDQVIPVFLSAALGMSVGVGLEYFKSYRERKKVLLERDKNELTQLNVVATAMGYNIEALLHIVMQQVLPHHGQSHAAATALRAVENSAEQRRAFGESMHSKFTAMMTRCPEPYFVELEFFKEIPFVLAKDLELLKLSGWRVSYARALKEIISERNKRIDIATSTSADEGSYLQAIRNRQRCDNRR